MWEKIKSYYDDVTENSFLSKIKAYCNDGKETAIISKIKSCYNSAKDYMSYNLKMTEAITIQRPARCFDEANALIRQLAERNAPEPGSSHYQEIKNLNDNLLNLAVILKDMYDKNETFNSVSDDRLTKIMVDSNASLLDVTQRVVDKNFYVGIIGEFSCGKSTFINAMLEERFLIEDVLQGTTCSKTTIKYSPAENIKVIFNDDKYVQMKKDEEVQGLLNPEEKREYLRMMTADEDRAKKIREVIWESPIEVLRNGMSIVDTPGIGSLNPRHTEVARNAAQSCDALLVLTNLEKALSQELTEEVKKIAGPQASNCIFIGTRKDQFRPKELQRLRRHFQKRLNSLYGHNCQFEFVCAYNALEELENNAPEKGALDEFRAFRAKIKDILEGNRQYIQSIKAAELVRDTTDDLTSSIKRLQDDLISRIREYETSVIKDDSSKWSKWDMAARRSLKAEMTEIGSSAQDSVVTLVDKIRSNLKYRINSCDDSSELKAYLKDGISSSIKTFTSDIENAPRIWLEIPLLGALKKCQKSYSANFQEEYKKLAKLFPAPKQIKNNLSVSDKLKITASASSSGFGELSANIDTEENIKIGGGLATGIGVSLLVPGVGWIVGGALTLLGGILGAGFLKSLDTRKREACDQVDQSMDEFEKKLRVNIEDNYKALLPAIDKNIEEFLTFRKNEYKSYIAHYNKVIENQKKDMENMTMYLEEKIGELKQLGTSMSHVTQKDYFIFDEKETEVA